MTTSAVIPQITFAGSSGSGTLGPFSLIKSGTPIYFTANSQIKVYRYDTTTDTAPTLLVEGTDYDLTGGPSAGSITLTSPQTGLLTAERLFVYREQPITQSLDLGFAGNFSSGNIEARLDRTYEIIYELRREVQSAVRFSLFDTDNIPNTLPLGAVIDKLFYISGTTSAPTLATIDSPANLLANIQLTADNITNINLVGSDLGGADTIGIVAADLDGDNSIGTVAGIASLLSTNIADIVTVATALDAGTISDLLDGQIGKVANKAALEAYTSPASGQIMYMAGRLTTGDGGHGLFRWVTGDQSSAITNDPAGIMWIAPSTDGTGASGAWKRQGADDGPINVFWAGAVAGTTAASANYASLAAVQADYPHATATTNYMDWLAVQAVLNAYPGRECYMPGTTGIYRWDQEVYIYDDNTALTGDGNGMTRVYSTKTSGRSIYVGPEDNEATAYIYRNRVEGFTLASVATSPDVIAIEARQCNKGRFAHLDCANYPKGILTSGGIGGFYEDLDIRHDPADTPPSDSYCMKFEASNRLSNGYQATFSHQCQGIYLSGEGELNCVLELGMGDSIEFVDCYFKSGVNGIYINPDAGDDGVRAEFTNCYLDGQSGVGQYGIYCPAFDETGQTVLDIVWNGGRIANFDTGSHVYIRTPTNGALGVFKFVGATFGASGDEAIDAGDTDQNLILVFDSCTFRNCDGGINVASANTLQVTNCLFDGVTNGASIAILHMSGTINTVMFTGNKINKAASSAASLLSNSATITNWIMGDNVSSDGDNTLMMPSMTIADDAVGSIPITLGTNQTGCVRILSYTGVGYGEVWFRDGGVTAAISGTISTANDTALAGTTGSDGAVTASYDDSANALLIENRSGASQTFYYERIV